MPTYEIICPVCRYRKELFTLSIEKMTKLMEQAKAGKFNEVYCGKCKRAMSIVIHPHKVDMNGDIFKS